MSRPHREEVVIGVLNTSYEHKHILWAQWLLLIHIVSLHFAEMNTLMMQMRHTAHELQVTLDHVLRGGETSMAPQNNDSQAVSFLGEPTGEMSGLHDIPEVRATAQLSQLNFIGEEKSSSVTLLTSFLSGRPQFFVSLWESSSTEKPLRTDGGGHGLQEVHLGSADDHFRQGNLSHTLSAGTEEHCKRRRFPKTAASTRDLTKHNR